MSGQDSRWIQRSNSFDKAFSQFKLEGLKQEESA